ncbi:glycoside hydrolase family 32 protein [Streptomyces aculeolatus]
MRPPLGWVNDPNGLVFHDGYYHVFFQHNPHSPRHTTTHWGHFRSRDLIHWEMLPTALSPDPDGEDADGVWSGNAVSHRGELRTFYSAKHPGRWHQPVAVASSADGLAFAKHTGLLVPEPPDGVTMFRDPYVWRDGYRWRMLVGAALADGRGAAVQYESAGPDDLDNWTYRGIFLARAPQPLPGGADTEEGWECAQYADFGDRRGVLLVSAWDPQAGAQVTAAWPGRKADGAFAADTPQRLDHGPDFYAPALLHAPDGRILMWAWLWEARDEPYVGAPSAWSDEAGWAGMLSLPRELTLATDGTVRQTPASEVDKLRGAHRIHASGSGPAALGAISPTADVTVRLEADGGLRLTTSADGREHLDIRRDADTGDVVADRGGASLDPRTKGGSWRLPAPSRTAPAELRIVLDRSVAEIFAADGQTLTLRFYPIGGDDWQLHATGAAPYAVDAWDLIPLEVTDLRQHPEGAAL